MSEDELARVQRGHLRRILAAFAAIVVTLPIAALGGQLYWLLAPMLIVAALALREAMRLRRSIHASGRVMPTRSD